MGRVLLIAILAYGYGDAGFDGHRPQSLDQPLREYRRTVDVGALRVQRALITLERNASVLRTLPMLGDQLRRVGAALAPAPGFDNP